MKNLIKRLLRESLENTSSYKLMTERDNRIKYNRLYLMLEKEIKVGDNLIKKLNSVKTPLGKKLLAFFNSDDIKDDANVDYVDYDKSNEKLITLGYTDRNGEIKQRLFKINKLLKYLGANIEDIKGYEIEDLISHLKREDVDQMRVVTGDDILKAYHCKNYDEGKTMGSCMRHERAQSYLEIYASNPEQIKCLVLFNPENGKVRGRALLFKMDNGNTFMDRIYTTNKEYNSFFNTYAEEQGFETGSPSDDVTLENGGEYDEYPYMDTFMYYTPYDDRLSASDGELTLQDTSGGDSSGIYSEIHDENIPEDQAAYVEHLNDGYGDWVYDHEIVPSWKGDEWLYRDSDDVVQLTAGEHEGSWVLTTSDEFIETYDGKLITTDDDYYYLEAGEHEGEVSFGDDVAHLTDGEKPVLAHEAVELTAGNYSGDIILKDDAWVLTGGDEMYSIISDDDLNEYEGVDKVRYNDYEND